MSGRLAEGEGDPGEVLVIPCEELASSAGLDRVGVAAVEPFLRSRAELRVRSDAGIRADMQFTYRNPERSTDPRRILEGAASLVVAAKAHETEMEERPATGTHARVARYASGAHYSRLRAGLEVVASYLEDHGGRARVIYDDNALVDREAARRAGLGTYGKNANLLVDGSGSWFVLGSVVTDLRLRADRVRQDDPCGPCRRCIERCPTGAIVDEGVVDARRCLAWLVQAGGTFPIDSREALHDRLYGCDTCQEVCPENRRSVASGGRTGGWIDIIEILDTTDEALLERHGSWYLADRDPGIIRRNALVVMGNVAHRDDPDVVRVLAVALKHPRPLIRAHAVWAARRLGLDEFLPSDETDEKVLAEFAHQVQVRV